MFVLGPSLNSKISFMINTLVADVKCLQKRREIGNININTCSTSTTLLILYQSQVLWKLSPLKHIIVRKDTLWKVWSFSRFHDFRTPRVFQNVSWTSILLPNSMRETQLYHRPLKRLLLLGLSSSHTTAKWKRSRIVWLCKFTTLFNIFYWLFIWSRLVASSNMRLTYKIT